MTYAVKQDLVDRFGTPELVDITDRTEEHTGTTIDDTILNRALTDANSTINSYLLGRYTLPLASTPDRLLLACCDIARYNLYDRGAPEVVRTRYQDQIKWLEQVAAGRVSLGLDADSEPTATASEAEITGPDRTFDDDTLADFLGDY